MDPHWLELAITAFIDSEKQCELKNLPQLRNSVIGVITRNLSLPT